MAENRPPGANKPIPKAPGPRSVRRNLFGTSRDSDVSLNNLARDRDELFRRQENKFKERWNFDIANDKPLEGRYEWLEAIPMTTSAPLLHVPPSGENICGRASNNSVLTQETLTVSCNQPVSSSIGENCPSSNDMPPIKKQRSSDSEDINGSSSHSKSPKR